MAGPTARRGGVGGIAGVVRVIGMLIVAVLVLHILFGVLGAQPENTAVQTIAQLAGLVDLGLYNLFDLSNETWQLIVNYGIAALAWWLITTVAVRLVSRMR